MPSPSSGSASLNHRCPGRKSILIYRPLFYTHFEEDKRSVTRKSSYFAEACSRRNRLFTSILNRGCSCAFACTACSPNHFHQHLRIFRSADVDVVIEVGVNILRL